MRLLPEESSRKQKDSVLQDPNAEQLMINPEKLRPVSRLGGITYGRTTQYVLTISIEVSLTNRFMEVPRPTWDSVKDEPEVKDVLSKPAKSLDA
jgi:hypothetical protein